MPTKRSERPAQEPARLSKRFSHEEAERQIQGRIEAGRDLLKKLKSPIGLTVDALEAEHRKWYDYTSRLLEVMFTTRKVTDSFFYAAPHYMRSKYDPGMVHLMHLEESVEKQVAKLESIIEQLPLYEVETADLAAPPPSAQSSRIRDVHVHIEGSTVGQLNLGQVIGNIETHLNAVTGASATELKAAVTELVEAVVADDKLSEANKRDVLDSIDYLSEQAATPTPGRRLALVKATLYWMGWAIGTGGSAIVVWDAVHPVLHGFFGI